MIAMFVACGAPAANAQSASDMGVVQNFVLGAIFGDQAEMREQLAPDAKLLISDGRLLNSGKLSQPAKAVDAIEFGKFFFQCQFEMSVGSFPGVHVEICTTSEPAKRRLVQFEIRGSKIISATMSRGWVNPPANLRLSGQR